MESRRLLTGGASSDGLIQAYGQLPLSFEANQGQTDAQVQFLSRGAGYALFVTPTETVLSLRGSSATGAVLRMQLVGASGTPKSVGLEPLTGVSNYLTGNDPSQWHTNVANFTRVQEQGVYPGVDLTYYGNQGQLEYDFTVAPGADPGAIRLSFQGADSTTIDGQGNLVLHTAAGDVVEHAPVLYQESGGTRQPVSGHYVIGRDGQVGFAVGPYDASKPLVIDPTLSYSTYLGGSGTDLGESIAVDAAGNAYVTGYTQSPNFPTKNALQPAFGGGGSDAFVSKINADGSALVYSTYLGGNGDNIASGIAVDAAGDAYVTGSTNATNFPTKNPLQPASGGGYDAFVTKINADGSALTYSTYLGGSGDESANRIALDSTGNAFVTGSTNSTNFPTANPFQPAFGGGTSDVFVTKLNAAGSALLYSTYLGGSGTDRGYDIAVDGAGNAYVIGETDSSNFPTAVPLQRAYGGGVTDSITGSEASDAFVTELNAGGSALVFSTYLGGSNNEFGLGIAVDSVGNAYVTGQTLSNDFPTANPIRTADASAQSGDAFVAKIAPSQSFHIPTVPGISSSLNPSPVGQPVTFTVFVGAGKPFSGTPTGLVTLMYGTTVLGTGTLDASGYATVTVPMLPQGNDPITALYGGDANFAATSGAVVQAVQLAQPFSTSTTLVSSPNPASFGQMLTLTATVAGAPAGPGTPSGTVTFLTGNARDGFQKIGSGTLDANGRASVPRLLTAGDNTFTANYSGDAFYAASSGTTTQKIQFNLSPSTTTLTASPNPSVVGQPVTFTAAVAIGTVNASSTGDTVTFTVDGKAQPPVPITINNSAGQATFTVPFLTEQPHRVSATYNGSPNKFTSSLSNTVVEFVNSTQTPFPTTVRVNVLSGTVVGQVMSFDASLISGDPANMIVQPVDGTVTFTVDGTPHPVTVKQAFDAFFNLALTAGPHTVTATYSGDATHAAGSGSASFAVRPAATNTTLTASPNPSAAGQPVTLSAAVSTPPVTAPNVAASPQDIPRYVGSVTFKDGSTVLATVPVSAAGTAVFTTATLAPGPHAITATFVNDPNFATSASNAVTETVNPVVIPPVPVPTAAGPVVVSVRRYGYHRSPTTLVVAFSGPLERTSAENPRNYLIQGPDTRFIPDGRATYDPRTHAVTLHPRRRLDLHRHYILTVVGSGFGGVRGSQGAPLLSPPGGRRGSDFTTNVNGANFVATNPFAPGASAALRLAARARHRR